MSLLIADIPSGESTMDKTTVAISQESINYIMDGWIECIKLASQKND
jgi:hypothetical protein